MLIITFGNPLYCFFSECRRGEYSIKIFGLSLAFNDFVVSSIILILSIVLSFSRFFIISLNSSGGYFCL